MMHQDVGHVFVDNAHVMTNSFHNAMLKAMQEGPTTKFTETCYPQHVASILESSNTAQAKT